MTPVVTCTLLQGIPGSGKSTLAAEMVKNDAQNPNMVTKVYCVTDYFYRNGIYTFNRYKLSEYYSHCMMLFAADSALFLRDRKENESFHAIVDNMNISHFAIRPYFDWMKKLQGMYQKLPMHFELVEPNTDWKYNPEECSRKSRHSATQEVCQQAYLDLFKAKNFETSEGTVVNQYLQYTLNRNTRNANTKTVGH